MKDLITEALEMCAIDIEKQPIRAEVIIEELCDALKQAQAEIDRLTEVQRWIPVTERLPLTEKPVQVYMPKLHMSVQTGFYTKYYGEDDGEWYEHWVASGDVTHWRELPAPQRTISSGKWKG